MKSGKLISISYAPILFTSGESLEYNPCKTTADEISSRIIFIGILRRYTLLLVKIKYRNRSGMVDGLYT